MSKQKGKYVNPISMGVGIAQQDFQNHSGIRNEHDDDAEFYSSLSQIAGPKPRGAAAAFAGFTEGLAHGAKKKSTAKKQEALSKYDRVMDYFRTQNMEMEKQLQWERQKEQEAETLRPYAVGGLETAYSGMPYEQANEAMRNIFEQMKKNNPNIKGDFISHVPNSPLLNIRDESGKYIVFPLTKYAGEEVSKRVQGEFIEKQRLGVSRDKLEVQKFDKGLPSKFGNKANQEAEANEFGSIALGNLKGRGSAALLSTATAEMNLAKEAPVVLNMLKEGEDIIKSNINLGKGFTNYLARGKVSKTLLDEKTRDAYEKLEKIASRVAETYIRAKGSAISDSERETIKKGLFDTSNLESSNKYNINSVRKELEIAKERGDFTGEELARGFIPTLTSFERYRQSRQTPQSGMANVKEVMIKTPDGKKIAISEEALDQAIANGAEEWVNE